MSRDETATEELPPVPRPFVTIWRRPRETIRAVVAHNPRRMVTLIACLLGVDEVLGRAAMRDAGMKFSLGIILAVALVLGPLVGIFMMWLKSVLIGWTGGWLGGLGRYEAIKAAVVWAGIPVLFALPFWIPCIAIFGAELFREDRLLLDENSTPHIALSALVVIQSTAALWSLLLASHTVAEVQGYRSAWRGLANILLAILVMAVPLGLLAGIISLFWKN